MVQVAPFRGLRYDTTLAGDLASVTAPPYDAIDEELQRRLYTRSPYNVVRLELGEDRPGDDPTENRYTRAAAELHRWREDGILVRDPTPALYVYEQVHRVDGREARQLGVIAALGLEPWSAGRVLPHERVFRGPIEDRLRLLAAMPVNTSPVYVLARRTPAVVADLIDQARAGAPLEDFRDEEGGVEHRLWAITDPDAHARVAAAFAGERLLMADGHHRYTTAVEYRDGLRAGGAGEGTHDAILAHVVGEDAGPVVRATHRLVRRLPPDAPARLRAAGMAVDESAGSVSGLVDALHEVAGPAIGLVTRAGGVLLTPGGEQAVDALLPSDAPAPVRELDVALLHALLAGPLGVPDLPGELRYTPDADEAASAVAEGRADGLFLLRPVGLGQVRRVAAAGALMPPKTTSFHPKPRTGVVMRALSD